MLSRRMPVSVSRRAWSWAGAWTATVLAIGGCHPFSPDGKLPPPATQAESPPKPQGVDIERELPGLASDAWVRTLPPQGSSPSPERRWRHPRLAELLAAPAARRPELSAAMDSANPVVAANAAIVSARWRRPGAGEPLVAAVRASALALPLRCAAAEALAELSDAVPRLEELLAEYGRCGPDDVPAYLPELHAELLYALARHADAADQPHFTAALSSAAADVRLAALAAWSRPGRGALPSQAADLCSDPEARVRAAALRAMAARPRDDAVERALAALGDYTLEVRLAGIAALGTLGGTEARAKLETWLEHPGESDRAAAVAALARLGADDLVRRAGEDEAWLVRAAVADALGAAAAGRSIDRRDAALLEDLLRDRSGEVQRRAVAALEGWPLEQAGPLLLAALEEGPYLRRKAAAAQLARRWPPGRSYSADAPPSRRADALAALRQSWVSQQAGAGGAPLDAAGRPRPDVISSATLDRAAALVERLRDPRLAGPSRAAVAAELREVDEDPSTCLETLVLTRGVTLPEAVYREVLAEGEEAFAALELLASAEVLQRRRGAEQLKRLAARQPLRPLAVLRLAELGTAEADPLVMRRLLEAVGNSSDDAAARLACAAVSHADGEVRRLGCEHLGAHPAPRHELALRAALDDENPLVAAAAARALGRLGRVADPMPLERLLAAADRGVRLEAATALARLGRPAGSAALERLTLDADPRVRCRAVVAMGELADPAYAATLIGLLDQGEGVGTAALASLPRVAGRDVPGATNVEKARLWKQWWAEASREP